MVRNLVKKGVELYIFFAKILQPVPKVIRVWYTSKYTMFLLLASPAEKLATFLGSQHHKHTIVNVLQTDRQSCKIMENTLHIQNYTVLGSKYFAQLGPLGDLLYRSVLNKQWITHRYRTRKSQIWSRFNSSWCTFENVFDSLEKFYRNLLTLCTWYNSK